MENEVKNAEILEVRDEPHLEIEPAIELPKVEEIKHNFGVIKEYAEKLKEFWEPVIFEEKDVTNIKPKRTKIKNLQEAIARYRIDTIKDFKKPIDDFEKTCKEIEATLKETYESLGNKIRVFEDAEKNKKQEIISKKIQERVVELQFTGSSITEKDVIFNDRWLNKTYDLKDVDKDIDEMITAYLQEEERCKQNQEILRTFLNQVDPNHTLSHEMYFERLKYVQDVNAIMKSINDDLAERKVENVVDTASVFDTPVTNLGLSSVNVLTTNMTTSRSVTFTGTNEQIEQIRQYAFELGMEEIKNG